MNKLLEIQSIIEDRAIPSDMNDEQLPFYFSESKDQYINILFMDSVHLLRSFAKTLQEVERLREENCELQGMNSEIPQEEKETLVQIWDLLNKEKTRSAK